MQDLAFGEADRLQLRSLGITEEQIRAQLEIFERSSFYVHLNRPCTLADGIRKIEPHKMEHYLTRHRQSAREGRYLSFVPASGAATRMFQALIEFCERAGPGPEGGSHGGAGAGDAARDFQRFIAGIERFAFLEELEEAMAREGLDLKASLRKGRYQEIVRYLVADCGLNYNAVSKGLLTFHRYASGNRTAFEEHLVEAVHYVQDSNGLCRLHFTVSPDDEANFRALLERVRPVYQRRYAVRYQVEFSQQKASSNTIAVDLENRPFRDAQGRLLFRPAGHGTLLENLTELQGDLIYLKNIDNVVPDHLKEETLLWKKVLGGCLVDVQEAVHGYLRALEAGAPASLLTEVARFCRDNLFIHLPETYDSWPTDRKHEFLRRSLDRPIRVCGMVLNLGEPGGGPFWVEGKDEALSLQIVEGAQVDFDSPEQQEVWTSATHFNPVDLVCAVRDYRGRPFNLKDFIDPAAFFITRKSEQGKDLKAFELPGLWNGSMANWITLFVEVPTITFNPVKTVNDLLRTEHQPVCRPPGP